MFDFNIKRLEEIDNYLDSKKDKGVQAFNSICEIVKIDSPKFVVLTFQYENIEALGNVNSSFKLYDTFNTVISHDIIDNITMYNYDKNNKWEEFCYWTLNEMTWKLIEIWMTYCFSNSKIRNEISIPFYFKHNYDSMEILDLRNYYVDLEKSEFERYFSMKKDLTIELIKIE